jgi:modulator of FtsH protease
MLGLFAISLVLLLFGSGGNPLLSIAILGISSALLIVDFNYVRRHATEDDVIWLATGIFVSIVNIFLSLLNLFGRN